MISKNKILTEDGSASVFEFIAWKGQPQGSTRQIKLVTRTNVDNVGIWHEEKRGEPFTLQSVVDAANFASAQVMMASYRLALDQPNLFRLLSEGSDYGTIALLDVKEIEIKALGLDSSGGLNAPSQALLTAEWKMVVA